MKTISKIALTALFLTTTVAAQADSVSGHLRSNGKFVAPYYRTPANGIPYDNLSYRGYPSQQPGYVSPRISPFSSELTSPKTMPYYGNSRFDTSLLPGADDYSLKPLSRRSGSFGF